MNSLVSLRALPLLLLASALGACTSYDPVLGNAPFLCGEGDACPEGYGCVDQSGKKVCVIQGGTLPDAGPSGFQCNDDSALGNNDTIAGAYQTPVDNPKVDFMLAGLAICPETDRDTYRINLTMANKGIRVITTVDSGDVINVSILNQGGTSIGNGVDNGPGSLKACAPNLPTGTYYAQAFSNAAKKNNYRLQITVVDNCAQ
ncbi:MAG: hypothetical protein KF773_18170 [Deltaproteobacteria bacterium]|nr:hypothetical protein [Deltaproteobacteria bacterium]MCW5804194.1 hypothetical protein [Deltaproteobacteria bacterium]